MLRQIKVKTQFDALHSWPAAPEPVEFLRQPHRHEFQVIVTLSVEHADRDLEFFIVKDRLDTWLQPYEKTNLGSKSCETIAEEIGAFLQATYPGRLDSVEVSEDGQNSAIVTFYHYVLTRRPVDHRS